MWKKHLDGESRAALTSCGAKVLLVDLDPSGNPESFSVLGFQDDCSAREWTYLDVLCEKLVSSRHGERYQGAKLAQWMNG